MLLHWEWLFTSFKCATTEEWERRCRNEDLKSISLCEVEKLFEDYDEQVRLERANDIGLGIDYAWADAELKRQRELERSSGSEQLEQPEAEYFLDSTTTTATTTANTVDTTIATTTSTIEERNLFRFFRECADKMGFNCCNRSQI